MRRLLAALSFLLWLVSAQAQEGATIGSGVYGVSKLTTISALSVPFYVTLDPANAVTATRYFSAVPTGFVGGDIGNPTSAPFTTPGKISNFCVGASAAITTGSYTVSVGLEPYTGSIIPGNVISTPLSVTLDSAHQYMCDTVDVVGVNIGMGVVTQHVLNGSPNLVKLRESFKFTSAAGQEAPICGTGYGAMTALGNWYPFNSRNTDNATESAVSMLFSTAGTIDNLAWTTGSGAGAGNTWVATVFKNGVATNVTAVNDGNIIANGVGDSTPSHNFHVVAGDTMSWQIAAGTGSPLNPAGPVACVRWRPDTAGEYPLSGFVTTGLTTNATRYVSFGSGATAGSSTEINMGYAPINHTFKNLRLFAPTSPGAAATWTMTMFTGAVPGPPATSTALTQALTNANSAQCACSLAVTAGQLFDFHAVMSSTAVTSPQKWAATLTVP